MSVSHQEHEIKKQNKFVYCVYPHYKNVSSSNALSELGNIIQCMPEKLSYVHISYDELESMLQHKQWL